MLIQKVEYSMFGLIDEWMDLLWAKVNSLCKEDSVARLADFLQYYPVNLRGRLMSISFSNASTIATERLGLILLSKIPAASLTGHKIVHTFR